MGNRIAMVTSIAPKNIEIQQKAIKSWVKQGFKVISCNIQEEIEQIRDMFQDVEFVKVERDARAIIGKPCPYIYDMLQVLRDRAYDVCGIVNSDIHLKNFSDNVYEFVRNKAKDAIVFMRRQEIEALSDVKKFQSTMFFGGIDVFWFQKEMIAAIEDDGLILGQAMWDYWFPIMAHKNGIKIRELINPFIFHVTHAVQWDDSKTEQISWNICRKHFKGVGKESAVAFLKDRFLQIISGVDLQLCYIPKKMSEKSVLIIGEGNVARNFPETIKYQTHKNVTYIENKNFDGNVNNYDYIIKLPFNVIMCDVFVDATIWIMENYDIDDMQMEVYFRGNNTRLIKMENMSEYLVNNFNRDIEPLMIYRCKGNTFEKKKQELVKICRLYVCSVFIEEREQVIWERERTEGRVLIYTAGYTAQTWLRRYLRVAKEIEILGFIDKNMELQGRKISGFRVYPPSIVHKKDLYDKIMIVTNLYSEEIYSELIKVVQPEKVQIWNEYNGVKWKETREKINFKQYIRMDGQML